MGECVHPVKVLRFKIDSRGRYMYIYQCGTCHFRIQPEGSSAVPATEA
jgi:hypothetical protein